MFVFFIFFLAVSSSPFIGPGKISDSLRDSGKISAPFTGPGKISGLLRSRLKFSTRTDLVIFGNGNIFTTRSIYNGSFSGRYEGLYSACNSVLKGSRPCTSNTLIDDKFWLYNIVPAWVVSIIYNCVGFSSHDQSTMGMCIWSTVTNRQLIQCSCDMNISVCCHI